MSKRSLKRERRAEAAADTAVATSPQVSAGSPDSPSYSPNRQFAYAALLLIAAAFAIYARAARFPLVHLDDDRYIENIYTLRGLSWSGFQWAFFGTTPPYWHPLTWLSHMLDVDMFGGGATGGPHLVNVLLHATNAVLVMALLKRLTGKLITSAAVALLFAVHPLRVESVAWLAERKDVLCAFFSLVALYAYAVYAARAVQGPRSFLSVRYGVVLAAGACAMMSKPMAVTLPFVMLLMDWWPLERLRPLGWRIAEKLPLLAFSALTIRNVLSGNATEAASSIDGMTVGGQIANAINAYGQYLWATIWPHPLALIYPYSTSIPVVRVVASALVLLVITAVVVRQWKRRPYLAFGWFWFVGMLVPVIGVVQSGMQSRADRFTYLPHVGLLMALVWLVSEVLDKVRSRSADPQAFGAHRLAAVAVLLIAAAFGTVSWFRLNQWSEPFQLYAHDLQATGNNPRLELQYGILLLGAGRAAEAETHFRNILASNAQANAARVALANALGSEKRYAESAAMFREALKTEPSLADAHMGLAMAEMNIGSTDGNPKDALAKDDAAAHFLEALRLGLPTAQAAQVHNNLGVILMEKGQARDAFSQFQSALASEYRLMSAHRNIALALIQMNRSSDAAEYLDQTIKALGPDPILVKLRESLK